MTDAMFERALRQKLRFNSPVGELTIEQLWDLPLVARGQLNLDNLARGTHRELREMAEDSFVEKTADPRGALLELRLDILKHIIAVKIDEQKAAEKARDNAEMKRKLLSALDAKQTAELDSLSKDELEKKIRELSGS